MNANHKNRIEKLEGISRRWTADNTVHEFFEMDNRTVHANTWTQKGGLKRGDPIEFETVRAALDWILVKITETAQAQIYVDDLRDILSDGERAAFDALYFDAPEHKVMFDVRSGTDITTEVMRLWRHILSGIRYREWWAEVEERYRYMFQIKEYLQNTSDTGGA